MGTKQAKADAEKIQSNIQWCQEILMSIPRDTIEEGNAVDNCLEALKTLQNKEVKALIKVFGGD